MLRAVPFFRKILQKCPGFSLYGRGNAEEEEGGGTMSKRRPRKRWRRVALKPPPSSAFGAAAASGLSPPPGGGIPSGWGTEKRMGLTLPPLPFGIVFVHCLFALPFCFVFLHCIFGTQPPPRSDTHTAFPLAPLGGSGVGAGGSRGAGGIHDSSGCLVWLDCLATNPCSLVVNVSLC